MNRSLTRIAIGVICILIACYLIFSTKEEIEMWQIVVGAYGLFSTGMGLYFYQKEKNAKK